MHRIAFSHCFFSIRINFIPLAHSCRLRFCPIDHPDRWLSVTLHLSFPTPAIHPTPHSSNTNNPCTPPTHPFPAFLFGWIYGPIQLRRQRVVRRLRRVCTGSGCVWYVSWTLFAGYCKTCKRLSGNKQCLCAVRVSPGFQSCWAPRNAVIARNGAGQRAGPRSSSPPLCWPYWCPCLSSL